MTTSVCPVPAAVQLYSGPASQQEVYSVQQTTVHKAGGVSNDS